VGFNPQESLAQHDESRDVLDPIWVEMLQLDLVVVEEPPKEGMRGCHEPTPVEVRDGDDVTIARHRHLLTSR
jgi:hypothetical protein